MRLKWSIAVGGTHGKHTRHAFGVLPQQGVVAAVADRHPQRALCRIQHGFIEAVIRGNAGAPIAYQPGFLQLGQVGGHARLRQLRDRGQLGDRQFLGFEQAEQAHARCVGEHPEPARPAFQIHGYLHIAI